MAHRGSSGDLQGASLLWPGLADAEARGAISGLDRVNRVGDSLSVFPAALLRV